MGLIGLKWSHSLLSDFCKVFAANLQICQFLFVRRFGYYDLLSWVCFGSGWKVSELYLNFMLIRRYFMYFADFWANFWEILTFVLFYCLKWVMKRPPFYLNNFSLTKGLQYFGSKAFCCAEKLLKMAKIETIFLKFLLFFDFLRSSGKFLSLLWLAYCFAKISLPYCLKGNFLWIYVLL